MRKRKGTALGLLSILLILLLSACQLAPSGDKASQPQGDVIKGQSYSSAEDVAAYLKAYGELPENFITKAEAKDLGWVAEKGNLAEVAPGKSIGGDKFGNREGTLPKKSGRTYYECDINYKKGSRGAERIVYSNDGLIFYSKDHYKTFEEIK